MFKCDTRQKPHNDGGLAVAIRQNPANLRRSEESPRRLILPSRDLNPIAWTSPPGEGIVAFVVANAISRHLTGAPPLPEGPNSSSGPSWIS